MLKIFVYLNLCRLNSEIKLLASFDMILSNKRITVTMALIRLREAQAGLRLCFLQVTHLVTT